MKAGRLRERRRSLELRAGFGSAQALIGARGAAQEVIGLWMRRLIP
jgi:hypothetical protein